MGKRKSDRRQRKEGRKELMLWALTEKTPLPLRRGQERRQERRPEDLERKSRKII